MLHFCKKLLAKIKNYFVVIKELKRYYIIIEVMKDVIILGIQQYRIPALFSTAVSASVRCDSQTYEKCHTSSGKFDFLCFRRTEISDVIDGFGTGELFSGIASGKRS